MTAEYIFPKAHSLPCSSSELVFCSSLSLAPAALVILPFAGPQMCQAASFLRVFALGVCLPEILSSQIFRELIPPLPVGFCINCHLISETFSDHLHRLSTLCSGTLYQQVPCFIFSPALMSWTNNCSKCTCSFALEVMTNCCRSHLLHHYIVSATGQMLCYNVLSCIPSCRVVPGM